MYPRRETAKSLLAFSIGKCKFQLGGLGMNNLIINKPGSLRVSTTLSPLLAIAFRKGLGFRHNTWLGTDKQPQPKPYFHTKLHRYQLAFPAPSTQYPCPIWYQQVIAGVIYTRTRKLLTFLEPHGAYYAVDTAKPTQQNALATKTRNLKPKRLKVFVVVGYQILSN